MGMISGHHEASGFILRVILPAVVAGIAIGITMMVMLELASPPPAAQVVRPVEAAQLPPGSKTPQQRIDEAWDAMRRHQQGYR
jgi:hypothetical protein